MEGLHSSAKTDVMQVHQPLRRTYVLRSYTVAEVRISY